MTKKKPSAKNAAERKVIATATKKDKIRWQEWNETMEGCPFHDTLYCDNLIRDHFSYFPEKCWRPYWHFLKCKEYIKLKSKMIKKIEKIESKYGKDNSIPVIEWKKLMVAKVIKERNEETKTKYLVYNENIKLIYDFDLDFKENSKQLSIISFVPPQRRFEFKGEVYFFGYRIKQYDEVKNKYSESDYNIIKEQYIKYLESDDYKNWIGQKYIFKALEKIYLSVEIDPKKYNYLDTLVCTTPKNLFERKCFYDLERYCSQRYVNFEALYTIGIIKNYKPVFECSLNCTRPDSIKEKIWFNVRDLCEQIHWEYRREMEKKQIPKNEENEKKWKEEIIKPIEEDTAKVEKMIESYNKTGDFNFSGIAENEEEKFRKYFREYLEFEDTSPYKNLYPSFVLYDLDSDNTNILLLDSKVLNPKRYKNKDTKLNEILKRIENLIGARIGDNAHYKIFCFTEMNDKMYKNEKI